MVAGSFTRENVLTFSLNRVWKGVLDAHNLIPKLLPDFISSVETIEGDGGLGTIRKINFTKVEKEFSFITKKIEVLDTVNHILKKSVIEGGLIGRRLRSYSTEIKLEVVNNSGTLGKFTVEYDTIDDTPLADEEEEEIMKGFYLSKKAFERYLVEYPTSYA